MTEYDYECAKALSQYYSYGYSDFTSESFLNNFRNRVSEDCPNASFEAVKLLIQVKSGVATPLKITFDTAEPYYPMRMSSINSGNVDILAYAISDSPMNDKSSFLSVSGMTENPSWFSAKYGMEGKYITKLKYNGDVKALNQMLKQKAAQSR